MVTLTTCIPLLSIISKFSSGSSSISNTEPMHSTGEGGVDIEVISLLHHGLMERKVLAGSRATRVDMNLHSVKMPGMWS